jgi:CRP-like cAMP-binding protein
MYQSHMAVIGESLWSQLRGLAPMRVRPARSVLLRQGDPGTHVVLLASGSTLVTLTGPNGERALLAVRGPGELLGELAVLDAQPRSASVIAAESCRVHLIPAPEFLAFIESNSLLNRNVFRLKSGMSGRRGQIKFRWSFGIRRFERYLGGAHRDIQPIFWLQLKSRTVQGNCSN